MPPKKKKMKVDSMEIPTSIMECPVCLEVIKDPPIFQCENTSGHSVCAKCHAALRKAKKPCPVCRSQMDFRRNITLESVVDSFPNKVRCKFDGCDIKRSSVEAMKAHEGECKRRHVPCAFCDAKIGLENLAVHIMTNHHKSHQEMKEFAGRWGGWILIDAKRIQTLFTVGSGLHKAEFVLNYNSESDPPILWLSSISSKRSDANLFEYTIKVTSNEDKKAGRKVFLSQSVKRCVACDLSHEEVRKSGSFVAIGIVSREDAKKENDGKLDLQMTINKVK